MAGEMLHLELITPSSVAAKLEASEVILPGFLGEMTILPGHAPLIAQIRPGVVHIQSGKGRESFVLGSGFIEVTENKLLILTRSVESKDDLDGSAVKAGLTEAITRLGTLSMDSSAYAVAQEKVELEAARLKFLG